MAANSFQNWLTHYDPTDQSPDILIDRFLCGINELGIDVYRSSMWLPTSHPELWGTQVIWLRGKATEVLRRDHHIASTSIFLNTPGEAVYESRTPLRWRLDGKDDDIPYPMLQDIRQEGGTDYFIVPLHCGHDKDMPWITFTTQREGGFSTLELNTLEDLTIKLSWKARVTVAEMASRSLLSVYLGRNAAQRVMNGEFKRGTGERINAVILFCDMRGFTRLGDTHSAEDLVEILDHYFECLAMPVEQAGGEILKFIGDAVLAIFPIGDTPGVECEKALSAAEAALKNLAEWSGQDDNRPTLKAGIALHIGEVLYGNIGGSSRLDFTVIGSTVNEASRIESLCKQTYPILLTEGVKRHLPDRKLASIGEQELRGVTQPLELFTLASMANPAA